MVVVLGDFEKDEMMMVALMEEVEVRREIEEEIEERGSGRDGWWCRGSSSVVACRREVVDVVEEVMMVVVEVRKKMVEMEGEVGVDGGVDGRILRWRWCTSCGSSPEVEMGGYIERERLMKLRSEGERERIK